MSSESSNNSASGQIAAVRPKPAAAAEPPGKRGALADKAREVIFGGGEAVRHEQDRQQAAHQPAGDEGRPATPSNRRDQARSDVEPERRHADPEAKGRPALELADDDDKEISAAKRQRGKTIADYAAEQEVDPQEIYKLNVPIGDNGETMSIGELKDRVKESHDFERRRDDFEDWRDQALNEVAHGRMQVEGVLQRLTSVIPPEQLASVFADYEHSHTRQVSTARLQLREWFPEWDDAAVKARDREKLDEHLGSYGFSRFEIENLTDARLVRYAMHAMRLMERYRRLKDAGKREKIPTTEPPSSRKHKRDVKTEAANLAKSGDVVGAVRQLLR